MILHYLCEMFIETVLQSDGQLFHKVEISGHANLCLSGRQ